MSTRAVPRFPCCWGSLMYKSCTCPTKLSKYDERELAALLTYAGKIYHHMARSEPHPEWAPCETASGMLSQMSNTLRGIHDLAAVPLPWTKDIPSQAGLYWHWNEDDDCAPMPYNIDRSLTDGKPFATEGQYGMTRYENCEDMGGWWMPCEAPETPKHQRIPDAYPATDTL